MNSISQKQLDFYHAQGYLILRRTYSKSRIQSLVDGVFRMIDLALAGECELNWINKTQRLPQRTPHLLNPDKYQPAFGEWLAEDLVPQIETLVGGAARHSLFGMLASGGGKPYKQSWHRDFARGSIPDEAGFLSKTHGDYVQFNAPLVEDDRYLNIVPASHLRASTDNEIRESKGGEAADMPSAMVVELEPGDIVYYNANLWHRGWNPEGNKRWTLHCANWVRDYPVMSHEYGQQKALLTPGHLARMPAMAQIYMRRYLDAYPEGEPMSLYKVSMEKKN